MTQIATLTKLLSDPAKTPHSRRPEVDFTRGIAILLMVVYHLTFDLSTFGNALFRRTFPFPELYIHYAPYFIGGLFLILLGVSSWLRVLQSNSQSSTLFFHRALQLGLISLTITAVSAYVIPDSIIYFGILHCMAVSLLLLSLFTPYFYLNLFAGITLIALGFLLEQLRFQSFYFVWLGLVPQSLVTSDYYPLLPWFGFSLIGLFLGRLFYPTPETRMGRIRSGAPWRQTNSLARVLIFWGRHSLVIYLAHQPILLGLLFLLGKCLTR